MRKLRGILPAVAAALLASAGIAAAQQPTVVILVRHGEKVTTDPRDPNPALTPAGQQRARDLWEAVRGSGVDAVLTTDFLRTRSTVQPTADSLHLTPEVVRPAAGGSVAAATAEAVRRHAGHTVLVAGHSNTIHQTIAALGGPAPAGDICDAQYGNLYILVIRPGEPNALVRSHYGAAGPADGGCGPGMR